MPETIFSRRYQGGEVIFRTGDRGRNAYIIEKGRVEVSIERAGEMVIIAELGIGEIFGEMSMIDDAPRSATVTALEDTEVVVIQRWRLMQPLESADPMMNLLLRVVLARFRDAQRQLSGLKGKNNGADPALDEIRRLALNRINTERGMRGGLENEEFEMHYQPIVSLDGGHIAGFEALMRWQKAGGGFVSPVEFIPVAEETGLIIELGRFALETGLRDQLRIANAFASMFPHLDAPFMSINVSGLQLSELSEIDQISRIINESGADPSEVKLEITETLMVDNPEHAANALRKLKSLGVSIAIDDFGTGYSSLSYLHQFPLDTLKIDRAFVVNMDTSENSRRIVHSIAQLALALDMNIVAEGIEEKVQMDDLKGLGCQYGQGYHMSKPLPVEKALDLISAGTTW